MKISNNKPTKNEMEELENLFKKNSFDILEKKIERLIVLYPKISNLYNILGVVLQILKTPLWMSRGILIRSNQWNGGYIPHEVSNMKNTLTLYEKDMKKQHATYMPYTLQTHEKYMPET